MWAVISTGVVLLSASHWVLCSLRTVLLGLTSLNVRFIRLEDVPRSMQTFQNSMVPF